jgi:ethanolamine ammonia-lyase large subunit
LSSLPKAFHLRFKSARFLSNSSNRHHHPINASTIKTKHPYETTMTTLSLQHIRTRILIARETQHQTRLALDSISSLRLKRVHAMVVDTLVILNEALKVDIAMLLEMEMCLESSQARESCPRNVVCEGRGYSWIRERAGE